MLLDRSTLVAAALTLITVDQAAAQCRIRARLGGAGTIAGTVYDTSLNVVDNVDVYLGAPRRRVLATYGRFRFDSLAPGEYQLSARRLGYAPQLITVTVGDSGGVAAFCLVAAPRALPPIVSSMARGGFSGVVTDTAGQPISDADIQVFGDMSGKAASDDAGAFYIKLKSGRYMARIQRPWFETAIVSVTIPRDSGRHVQVRLTPTRSRAIAAEAAAMFDISRALANKSSMTKVYTRDDLDRTSMTEVSQLAQAGTAIKVDDNCLVDVVGGGMGHSVPMWTIKAEDIEFLVVSPKPMRVQRAQRRESMLDPVCNVTVLIWTRR